MVEWSKGPVCGVQNCKSTKYVVNDGIYYCSRGHQRAGAVETVMEYDDVLTTARSVRFREARSRIRKTYPRVYQGHRGLALYVQALQTILHAQVNWLIDNRNMPAIIDPLAQRLFAAYMRYCNFHTMSLKTDNKDANEASESEYEFLYSNDSDSDQPRRKTPHPQQRYRPDKARARDRSKYYFNFSAQIAPIIKNFRIRTLADLVVLCYIACLVVHAPICMLDLHHWIISDTNPFPYINAASLTLSNRALSHLHPHYSGILNPKTFPGMQNLLEASQELVGMTGLFKHTQPPLFTGLSLKVNHEHIMLRTCQALLLPIDVFCGALQFVSSMSWSFSHTSRGFPVSHSTVHATVSSTSSGAKLFLADHPELRAAAAVVVAAKLLYGLDGIKRKATEGTGTELTAQVPDWTLWDSLVLKHASEGPSTALYPVTHELLVDSIFQNPYEVWKLDSKEFDSFVNYLETRNIFVDPYGFNVSTRPSHRKRKSHLQFADRLMRIFSKDSKPDDCESSDEDDTDSTQSETAADRVLQIQRSIKSTTDTTTQNLAPWRYVPKHTREPPVIKPGAFYCIVTKSSGFEECKPRRLVLLLQALAAFLALPPGVITDAVSRLEAELTQRRYTRERGLRPENNGSDSNDSESNDQNEDDAVDDDLYLSD
ncbi:hypothetical protein CANCADRAFT_142698 [Tortispora caseinolytica NRRL Y-17796]|uniref:Uncharacterized protein n=1 Tax=Tortispora caseinolytica NRRL Y-17796 TaxID=767744 RepID=A0A1E4TDC9_9ASCO|nr:hypothetical protein CANCADRAFT_142698 [Tortispora caseinolytica NRRL Y-17796]